MAVALTEWNKRSFGNIFQRKKRLLARLQGIQTHLSRHVRQDLINLEKKLSKELEITLHQEELVWFQRSRAEWIASGDRNTKFYHMATLVKSSKARVNALTTDEGQRITEESLLMEHVRSYFTNLFSEPQSDFNHPQMQGSFPELDPHEWQQINRPFQPEEIKQALFEMDACKSPGPDGFTAGFFQKSWEVVGDSLVKFALDFFAVGKLHPGCNDTVITLIPKVSCPESVKQLRPIGLCNITYKILTKTMANRLREASKKLIGPNQTSFVPGRQISDNIIVLQEVLNSMNVRKATTGWIIMKVDLEKAYDKLDWRFIEETLTSIGFNEVWRRNLMECITTPRMAINWNRKTSQWFLPKRGIRQGDPISPLLFILCIERLGHLINTSVQNGNWRGIKLSRQGPHLSHLFFADDMILFGEATITQAEEMIRCLNTFCEQSGQRVNTLKSSLLFSKNTHPDLQQRIMNLTGIPRVEDLGKYLGVPSIHGRLMKATYSDLIDRIQGKLAGWKSRTLTMAGRIVLAQSVLSSMPYYTMQSTFLPKGVVTTIEKLIRNFIWGSSPDQRRCHLLSWETITKPKEGGGLGLRRLEEMNEAFIAKLGWRLIQKENCLWTQVLKAKYAISSEDCATWRAKPRMSNIWKGILRSVPILRKGMVTLVRNGKGTSFWLDKWMGEGPLIDRATSTIPPSEIYKTVDQYWNQDSTWNVTALQQFLPVDILDELTAIILFDEPGSQDQAVWSKEPSGSFSVRTAYDCAAENSPSPEAAKWNAIWKLKLPSRIKVFLWLSRHERIMTNKQRMKRGFATCDKCWCCKDVSEDIEHTLRRCPAADEVWRRVLPDFYWRTRHLPFQSWLDNGIANKGNGRKPEADNSLFALALWWIWKWRNEAIFTNTLYHLQSKVLWINTQMERVTDAFLRSKLYMGSEPTYQWESRSWTKPEPGMVKINFDGSLDPHTKRAGCGGVVRDSSGNWLYGFTNNIGSCAPDQAEAWGLLRSIQAAVHMGYRNIIVEGDSKEVIDAMSNSSNTTSSIGNILKACRQELRQIETWKLELIPREINTVADQLAKSSRLYPKGLHLLSQDRKSVV